MHDTGITCETDCSFDWIEWLVLIHCSSSTGPLDAVWVCPAFTPGCRMALSGCVGPFARTRMLHFRPIWTVRIALIRILDQARRLWHLPTPLTFSTPFKRIYFPTRAVSDLVKPQRWASTCGCLTCARPATVGVIIERITGLTAQAVEYVVPSALPSETLYTSSLQLETNALYSFGLVDALNDGIETDGDVGTYPAWRIPRFVESLVVNAHIVSIFASVSFLAEQRGRLCRISRRKPRLHGSCESSLLRHLGCGSGSIL